MRRSFQLARFIFIACFLFLAPLFFSACATTSVGDFPSIKVGMEKSTVVETMGSPFRSERESSSDTWVYRFYEDETHFTEKVVIFEKGRVVYTGVPITHNSVLKGMPAESHAVPAD